MKGYTCCIDLQELGNTVEVLSSVENCIINNNLANVFSDTEKIIKKRTLNMVIAFHHFLIHLIT